MTTGYIAKSIDDYAKDGGSKDVWLLCNFYRYPKGTSMKTNINWVCYFTPYGFEIEYTGSEKLFEATISILAS